ncbi:unnamed protein product [Aphanomyces euteiches]
MSVAASLERGPVAFNDPSTAGSTPSHKKTPTKLVACEISHPPTDRSMSSKNSMVSFAIEPKKTTPPKKVGADRKHPRLKDPSEEKQQIVKKKVIDEETSKGSVQQRALKDMRQISTLCGKIAAQAPWKRTAGIGSFCQPLRLSVPSIRVT